MSQTSQATPVSLPDVMKAMNDLDNNTEELKNISYQLSERLCAILRPQIPSEGCGKLKEQCATPLAAQITGQAESVENSVRVLSDILSRIQI